jgi:hypothetical protein
VNVVTEVAALLAQIEGALDDADFDRLADLGVVTPAGSPPELIEVSELEHLLTQTNELRARVAAAMRGVESELRSVGAHRTAGRAYLSTQATVPPMGE